jgi:two-component system, LuxR family, response regulator FixJ
VVGSIIHVIDDNKEFRDSTSWMLEGVGYTVKKYSDPVNALKILSNTNTNCDCCCLLDVRMPGMTGLEFHEKLISNNINIPVIYMTGHGDVQLAVEAMEKGAITFLEKPLEMNLLTTAITSAFNKHAKKNNEKRNIQKSVDELEYKSRIESLTAREIEVLKQIVDGKLNKVVALDLGISVKTVELHRSRVMAKMHAHTATELVKMYLTKSVSN